MASPRVNERSETTVAYLTRVAARNDGSGALASRSPGEQRIASQRAVLLMNELPHRVRANLAAVLPEQQRLTVCCGVVLPSEQPVRVDAGLVRQRRDRVDQERSVDP